MPIVLLALIGCADYTPEMEQDTARVVSSGCGIPRSATAEQRHLVTEEGERGYHLVVPEGYDSNVRSRLIFGYPGTNWVGEQIRPYLGLEAYASANDIFVYPDPLWRDFDGWGNLGGWLLGPHASPAEGMGRSRY